jgi:hypothetical protein
MVAAYRDKESCRCLLCIFVRRFIVTTLLRLPSGTSSIVVPQLPFPTSVQSETRHVYLVAGSVKEMVRILVILGKVLQVFQRIDLSSS